MKLKTLAHFQSELTFLVKWSPGELFNALYTIFFIHSEKTD